MQLGTTSKTVGSSMAQLLTAAAQVINLDEKSEINLYPGPTFGFHYIRPIRILKTGLRTWCWEQDYWFIRYSFCPFLQGNENYTGIAARDTANALKVLMQAVRGVAATTNDRALQEKIIDCAIDVMDKSSNLIDEAKKAVNNPSNPDNQTRLAQVENPLMDTLIN